MIEISQEQAEDWWQVENLYDLSFAPGREALSSYRLREGVSPVSDLSMVARAAESGVIAAIRYWPIVIGDKNAPALLLGPIAVHPAHQSEGLGGGLMRASLQMAKELGWKRVILVGDYPYYQRFGFVPARELEFPPPTNPDRLLCLALDEAGFSGVSGAIKSVKSVASGHGV
ncbi:GNAT family N-acetyltransferase [Amylibacter marinus]|nr:N-acetyltransferase [Amylibacter marinus]